MLMFPNMTKEQVGQKYEACGFDINCTISAILDGAGNNSKCGIHVDVSFVKTEPVVGEEFYFL